jgi:HK97 family phage major capsid protein
MATFNPANVLLQDAKSGAVPAEEGTLIVKEVMSNSVTMQLAKYEEMSKQKKTFNYLADGVGAYWVGEGEIIQTSKPTWLTATMEAKKLGVIVPVSREFLQYSVADFFAQVRPLIAEAFYKKFDAATILGTDNPFTQSIEGSVTTAGSLVEGDLDGTNINNAIGLVEEADLEPNAWISKRANNAALRNVVDAQGNALYDGSNLAGAPITYLKDLTKGTLYTGDFNHARYGIPFNLNYEISTDAQLSSIVGEDGNPVNLFERELMAIRATMDVAFMVTKDDAFAKVAPVAGV